MVEEEGEDEEDKEDEEDEEDEEGKEDVEDKEVLLRLERIGGGGFDKKHCKKQLSAMQQHNSV